MAETDLAWVNNLVRESNAIEGIFRDPSEAEVAITRTIIGLPQLYVRDIAQLVSVYQPDAVLRDRPGLNVRVGDHIAPPGGPSIRSDLELLLTAINRDPRDPRKAHLIYETLHPFTDGNGRSGRAIWAWQIGRLGGTRLSFLHWWYYATLAASRC